MMVLIPFLFLFLNVVTISIEGFQTQTQTQTRILKNDIHTYTRSNSHSNSITTTQLSMVSQEPGKTYPELEKTLKREYASFFDPMVKEFYSPNVEFIDPLNKFAGIDKYQGNVDLLAGRTGLGGFLFKDASINLHNIEQLNDNQIQTRWTLQVTVKFLPWTPRPRFSGVSIYTLDRNGIVQKQEDYWDSINLKEGKYEVVDFKTGLFDFIAQIKQESSAEMSAPELPYELLRRAERYEIRRYPATLNIQTKYDQRPEGYDRLGSYAGGSNVDAKRLTFFSPTLMRITGEKEKGRKKLMTWPMKFIMPGGDPTELDSKILPESTITSIKFINADERVVAVTRFSVAATEPVVRGYTKQLINDVKRDGLTVDPAAEGDDGDCIVGQFDALFSLNKRRNEVWVDINDHPWK